MPINQLPEFYIQQEKYESAVTVSDKIRELEKLIGMMRKHKGTEKMMLQFHTKLAKLRREEQRQKKAKKSGRSTSIPKDGFQVVIIGFTNSGKSTFLKKMTNATPEISEFPFTTRKPEIGMLDFGGAKIQLVELPSLGGKRNTEILSWARNSDGAILIYRSEEEKNKILKILDENSISKPILKLDWNEKITPEQIFGFFRLIRVYTKQPGEKPDRNKPMVMKQGSTILDAAKEVHKDFSKKLKYACVWGSAKFQGQRVDKNFILKEGDVVEYHI